MKHLTDALPCGFEGYTMRLNTMTQHLRFVPYKTKYLKPGDLIYNPPFGSTSVGR
jgi:hypothetical protein